MEKPKFYIDQSDKYGDINVKYMRNIHTATGKNLSQLQLFHKGFMILSADFHRMHLKFFITDLDESEKIDILNEALRQMDFFRGLMIMKRRDHWAIIVEGRYVPFVNGIEIEMY